ncbi:DUF1016 N-terminal domain-containing protein [Paludisphaera borealis]|uniref:DUF1016 N-terminal domain-containing protein n=1 Tax=Paludisphaera borealis TaxID=1387353 RepID=UPI000971314E|nr:DUF1016 N-terminal domain-containing protein [Paludisphaera borealis]
MAQAVNSALVALYWQVGTRIRTDVLHNRRAGYGEKILPTLSAKLVPEYGQGFSERNLARMVRFVECLLPAPRPSPCFHDDPHEP